MKAEAEVISSFEADPKNDPSNETSTSTSYIDDPEQVKG